MEAASSAACEDFASETQPQPPEKQDTTQYNELNARELKFLERHRNKTRVFDPKGVYEFRHIKPTLLQSFIQLITMLISLALLFYYFFLGYTESSVVITGVGEVSSLTWIDTIEYIAIVVIMVIGLKNLGAQLKQHDLKSYRLAMFSNSLNRMMLNYIFMVIFILVGMFILAGIQDPTFETTDFDYFVEGVDADVFSALYSLSIIIITFRAFRFCRKELAE